MKPVLVTGATGFVGWHVAKLLMERGDTVRVLVRDPRRVRESGAEAVVGDLTIPRRLRGRWTGCEVLYHVAADYRLWAKDPRELYRSNVEGTRNVLEAARECRRRAGGLHEHGRLHRNAAERHRRRGSAGIGAGHDGAYKRSKFLAEQVALEFAQEAFPVVIVNPTAPSRRP